MGSGLDNDLNGADALVVACLTPEDFEEASEALLTLKNKSRVFAGKVALDILRQRIGDIYYRAHAFDVLYAADPDVAIEYIESCANIESIYVLGTMMASVTEDAGVSEGRDRILKAVALLRQAVSVRPKEELDSIAIKIAEFEEAYK